MGNCDAEIDREVDRVIDQILREDRLESMGLDRCPDSCEASCEQITEDHPHTNCAIETSARFSIRILEALRAVQRQKAADTWPSCTMEEVVQYIRRHYHYDGDLCSQVETALDQVTAQGFVLRMGANRYHLIGPFACSVPKPPTLGGCNRNRRSCGTPRSSRCRSRRRRPCTPNANSTFAAADCSAPFPRNGLCAGSNMEDRQPVGFQNGCNHERSLDAREDGRPFDEGQEVSILDEMRAPGLNGPIQRADGVHGRGRDPRDHIFDGVNAAEEVHPPVGNAAIRRPGGGARGRVIRDRIFDENVVDVNPHDPNEPIRGLRGCGGCQEEDQDQSSDENVGEIDNPLANGAMPMPDGRGCCRPVVREHSSDENMYYVEPANDTRGRRRCQDPRRPRRRGSFSSGSSCSTVISRCPARRSRSRSNFECSSDADVSGDSDVDDEPHGAKPWVRRCQNQDGQMCSRRGRRCSSRV